MSFVEDHGTSIFSQILSPAGEVVGRLPDISADELLRCYRAMVFGRLFSERMIALQRQGRMGTFSPVTGQEAVSVGMAAPLRQGDWVLGSYREYLAYHVKGVPLLAQLDRWGGRVIGHFPREAGCIPLQVVLGSQMLHAVGIAQAIKYDQAANVVVAACGDGATSEGDFSEALNFAGVFKAPVIFVVINNGWAISTPRAQQTAANYIADRGPGFGIPSYVVDGNDILALYQLMLDSIARARAGEGPTLVEAITYRLGAHTTADDPAKYRSETELAEWRLRDPLIRFRKFLVDRQMLTEAEDRRFYAEAETEISTTIEAFEALPPPKVQQLFDLVYADPTPQIQCQRERLLRELSSRQE